MLYIIVDTDGTVIRTTDESLLDSSEYKFATKLRYTDVMQYIDGNWEEVPVATK